MRRTVRFVGFAVAGIAAFFAVGWLVELLWNAVVAPTTGWHDLTYWKAIGILVLSKILFGGFGGRGGHYRRRRMRERWESMTPEEREKFREGMRWRCGHEPATPPPAQ